MNKNLQRITRIRSIFPGLFIVCSLLIPLVVGIGPGLCGQAGDSASACRDLGAVKQELELANKSLQQYKELYERKNKELNSLNGRLNTLQDGFDKFQEISARLVKEKEALEAQQNQLSEQLQKLKAQKLLLEERNRMLADCTKESDQKSLDIAALTHMSKTEQQNLSGKLSDMQKQFNAAMARNKDLSRKNSDLQISCSELMAKVAAIEKDNAQLRRQKEVAQRKTEDLSREIEAVKAKLMTAQVQNSKLKEAATDSAKYKDAIAQLESSRAELAKLKDENRKLSEGVPKLKDVETLRNETVLLRNEVAVLKKENRLQEGMIAKCKARESLPEELKRTQAKLEAVEKSKDSLIKEFSGKLKEQKKLIDEVVDLRLRVGQQQSRIEQVEEENGKLRTGPGGPLDFAAATAENERLKGELTALKEDNARLKKVFAENAREAVLLEELRQIREELARTDAENKKLQGAIVAVPEQTKALEEEIATLTAQITELKEENKKLLQNPLAKRQEGYEEGLAVGLQRQLNKSRKEYLNLQVQCMRLEKENIQLRQIAGQLKDQEALNKEIEDLRQKIRTSDGERDILRTEIARARKESGFFEGLKQGYEKEIEKLHGDIDAVKGENAKLLEETIRLKKFEAMAQLEEVVATLKGKYDILKGEHTVLSEKLTGALGKLSECEQSKKEISNQTEAAKSEIAGLRAKLEQKHSMVSKMKDDLKRLTKANKELMRQNATAVTQRVQETALASAQLEQLGAHKDGEMSALNTRFAQYRVEKDQEIRSLTENIAKLRQDLNNAQAVSVQLMQEKAGYEAREKNLAETSQRAQDQNTVLAGQIKRMEEQNAFLKNQFILASQEASDLKRSVKLQKGKGGSDDRVEQELQRLRDELQRKSEQLVLYEKSQGQGLSQENKQLIENYAELKQKHEQLTAQYDALQDVKKQFDDFRARAGKLPDENAMLHYNIGVMYAQSGEYLKAAAELEKVIELKPDDSEAYYNLGVIYGEYLNNRKKALVYFNKYLSLSPKDADADKVRRYVLTYEAFIQE